MPQWRAARKLTFFFVNWFLWLSSNIKISNGPNISCCCYSSQLCPPGSTHDRSALTSTGSPDICRSAPPSPWRHPNHPVFPCGGKVRWWTPATLYVKRQKLGNWAKDPSWLHTPQELPDLLNLVFSWWLPHVFIQSPSEYIPFFQDLVPLQQTKKLRGKKMYLQSTYIMILCHNSSQPYPQLVLWTHRHQKSNLETLIEQALLITIHTIHHLDPCLVGSKIMHKGGRLPWIKSQRSYIMSISPSQDTSAEWSLIRDPHPKKQETSE